MIVIRKRTIILIMLAILFFSGFFAAYMVRRSQVKIGDRHLRLNPFARIDSDKEYVLRLWEYDLAIGSGDQSYRNYLKQMLADFRKEYPNIRVELSLIDLLDGEKKLRDALKLNKAPDVYCSFNSEPEYQFRRQIPVGPFLSKKEQLVYSQPICDLYSVDRIMCSFSRWVSADIWIGNRSLLEKAGLDIHKIQNEGWNWEDLLRVGLNLPQRTRLLVGIPVNNGYDAYLRKLSPARKRTAIANIIALQKKIQTSRKAVNIEKDPLAEFSHGDCLLLAGVRPLIYLFLKDTTASGKFSGLNPVLLPAPDLLPGLKVQFIEGGVVNVYRNRYTSGDDHIIAALRLGQFISTYHNVSPWSSLGVFPTGTQAKLSPEIYDVYRQIIQGSVLVRQSGSVDKNGKISRFLNGNITVDDFLKNMKIEN